MRGRKEGNNNRMKLKRKETARASFFEGGRSKRGVCYTQPPNQVTTCPSWTRPLRLGVLVLVLLTSSTTSTRGRGQAVFFSSFFRFGECQADDALLNELSWGPTATPARAPVLHLFHDGGLIRGAIGAINPAGRGDCDNILLFAYLPSYFNSIP